jgi:hypothetical protein
MRSLSSRNHGWGRPHRSLMPWCRPQTCWMIYPNCWRHMTKLMWFFLATEFRPHFINKANIAERHKVVRKPSCKADLEITGQHKSHETPRGEKQQHNYGAEPTPECLNTPRHAPRHLSSTTSTRHLGWASHIFHFNFSEVF